MKKRGKKKPALLYRTTSCGFFECKSSLIWYIFLILFMHLLPSVWNLSKIWEVKGRNSYRPALAQLFNPFENKVHLFICSVLKLVARTSEKLPSQPSHFSWQGEDNITTYTFNTGQAKHTFCKTCGVESFYSPRLDPNGYSKLWCFVDFDWVAR